MLKDEKNKIYTNQLGIAAYFSELYFFCNVEVNEFKFISTFVNIIYVSKVLKYSKNDKHLRHLKQ